MSLTHLDNRRENYVRMLFIDYSPIFNTMVPTRLSIKLMHLGHNTTLCKWVLHFLTGRPQAVRVGSYTHHHPQHGSTSRLCSEPCPLFLYTH